MTRCFKGMASPLLICCLLAATLARADDRAPPGGGAYNPGLRYAYGPPPPSAYAAPAGGAYGPYGPPLPTGPYGQGSAQPNQRFLLEPFKGIFDKFNPFNKGGYPSSPFGGLPVPFGGVFPNPFAGLCNPVGGGYTGQGGGYGPARPPGYNPPSSDDAYVAPPSSGNRPIIIYTRPSVKSPTYSRPSDDRPSYDTPHQDKQMLTSRPHPLYG